MSYFTSDAIANTMKFTDRRYRSGDFIAEVLNPIRSLEVFYKSPAGRRRRRVSSVEMIIVNGEITDEGYRMILSLVGGKMMDNGIRVLMMARSDIEPEDKMIIMNKFAMFYFVWFETRIRNKHIGLKLN